jgi:WD40 repeat protein
VLVRKLLDGGIIRFAGKDENGNSIVELVNDELLVGWPELRKWIDADREFLLWRQQLHVDVVNSKQQKPREKWLAARASRDARLWLKTRPDDLTVDETKFLRSSISAANQRWFKIAAVIVLALMITVIGDYLIRKKWTSSIDQADAQRLATEAQTLIDSSMVEPAVKYDQLQLGALLALESQTLAPSDTTKALLDRALSRLVLARSTASLISNSSVVRIVWSSDGTAITMVTGRAKDVDPNRGFSPTREDRVVEIRDIASGGSLAGPIRFKDGVQKFSISSDGRYVAFSRTDPILNRMRQTSRPSYAIELLDLKTGQQTPVDTRQAQIYSIVFSPDSKSMITTGDENTAVLIDVENRKVLKKIRHQGVVTAASFSPDSQYVATVSDDFYARVWRVSDPEGSSTAKNPIKINSVATEVLFTPDQRRLITLPYLSGQSYAEMWELQDQEQAPVDQQPVRFYHSGIVRDVAISPDGKYVATLAENGEIGVWDALNARANIGTNAIQTIKTSGNISWVTFSTDSNYLVGLGDRAVASVWRLPDFGYTGLVANDGSVNDMAFNAASLFAIATESVQVWEFQPGISSKPCEHLTRSLSLEEWSRYLPNRPYRQICPDVRPASPQLAMGGP